MRSLDAMVSCAAMASSTLLGVAFGEFVDRNAPISAPWFPLAGLASLACLILASFSCDEAVRVKHQPISIPALSGVLAAIAALLMFAGAFSYMNL